MKTIILTILALSVVTAYQPLFTQGKRVPASAGREEYIEVEKNVRLQ